MSSDVFLTAEHEFKGDEYLVTVRSPATDAANGSSGSLSDSLLVEVESTNTYEQWSNEFTAKYVEELTSKTGNYKPFPTFLHMFQAALMKKSGTVSLDLLTLADLEKLRRQKSGSFASLSKSVPTSDKRYLILTYNVEFDRIHYPLVLQNRGQLDPIQLLASLRQFQRQDGVSKQGRQHIRDAEVAKLRKHCDELLGDKDELEQQLASSKEQARYAGKSTDSGKKSEVLKSVIRTLEGDLIKERTKHQRFAIQKRDAIRVMQEELDELRSADHALRMRVKYLTNELATYKRTQSYGSFKPLPLKAGRSASAERERGRSLSPKPRSSAAKAPSHSRSAWQEPAKASPSAAGQRHDGKQSFAGVRKPRFDPTAYVRQRAEKQQELERRGGRSLSRSPSPRAARRSRSNSVDSYSGRPSGRERSWERSAAVAAGGRSFGRTTGSRGSSLERRSPSLERRPAASAQTPPSARRPPTGTSSGAARGRSQQKSTLHASPAAKSRQKTQPKPRALNASPDDDTLDYDETRIADINARLNHLRSFMQASFPEKQH